MFEIRLLLSLAAAAVFGWVGLWLIVSADGMFAGQLQIIGLTLLLSAPVWGTLVFLVLRRLVRPAWERA